MHVVPTPTSSLYVLTGHGWTSEPAPWNPTSATQSESVAEPVERVTVCDGHGSQLSLESNWALYVFGGQGRGGEEVNPASAKHPDTSAKPDDEWFPVWGGHTLHGPELPPTSLYVPGRHADTALPPPVCPASALQSVKASLAVLLPVPELDGHSVQAASLFADALYVPAGHADTLLLLPLYPASARQSDSALLPVLVPVPVLVGHGVQAAALFASAL